MKRKVMKKYLFLLLIVALSFSCTDGDDYLGVYTEIEIDVENNSDDAIENIVLTTTEKIVEVKIGTLEAGKSYSASLSLKENKVDGAYIIKFTRKGKTPEEHELGYYSNGAALEKMLTIEFTKSDCKLKYPKKKK